MSLENECESTGRVRETRVKADESGSPHTEAGPVGSDKQLMGRRWGVEDERRLMGCRRTDSGSHRWQDKEEVTGC